MTTRITPSAALEAAIEGLLTEGLEDGGRLAELGRLGAQSVAGPIEFVRASVQHQLHLPGRLLDPERDLVALI